MSSRRERWIQFRLPQNGSHCGNVFLLNQGYHSRRTCFASKSISCQTVFKNLGYKDGDFPVSESVQSRIVSLPMHPFLTDEELDHIVEAVNSFSA